MSKIPDYAKCIFKGEVFDTYQWQQELYDGSFKTFEMLRRKHSINVIALQGKDIVYIEEEQPNKAPFRGLISGGAESYEEDPLETAKRELLEETGMISDEWGLLYSDNSTPRLDWTVYTYVAKNCQKVIDQNLDSGERIKVCKATVDNFCDELLTNKSFRAFSLKKDIMTDINKDKMLEFKRMLRL